MGKIEKIYENLKTNNENLPQEVHFFQLAINEQFRNNYRIKIHNCFYHKNVICIYVWSSPR